MSGLILPNKWTRQPQTPVEIDWSNPITRGISIASIPGSGARNLANPNESFSPNFDSGIGGNGRAIVTSTTKSYSLPNSPNNRANEFTAIVLCNATATLGQFRTPFTKDWNSGSGPSYVAFAIEYNQNGAGQNVLTAFTSTSANYSRTLNYTIPDARTPHLSGILRTASSVSAIFNGNIVATNTGISAVNYSGSGANDVWINSTYNKGDFNVYLALYWSRALSNVEIKALSDNPWQIFKSQSRRIWVGAAGGTNTAVNPGTGSIAITGYAPSIAQTANQAVAPDVGNIVITGYAPTISQPQAVNPGVGSLTITGYAPTVTQNVDVPVNPGVGTIAITGYAPTVAQTANQSVLPATGTIAITGYSPTVSQSANQAVTPDVGTITITGYAPTVQQAPASQNITPDVGTITITGYAPTVEQSSPLRLGGFEYGSKVYIKRNKKIYIFDSVEEADSYLEAEAKVEEIVQQSNKTSRLARKRAREKAFKSLAIEPVDTVDIPALKTLVAQLQTDFELPKLIAQQDWQRVVEIYNQAMEMQDEEDLLLIL